MTTQTALPKVPKDFPLQPRKNGQWGKKIKGKIYHFGVLADPDAALDKYLNQKDDLQAGRVPRAKLEVEQAGNTVKVLVDHYYHSKVLLQKNGELSLRTLTEAWEICQRISDEFGRDRLLTDIRIADFTKLRTKLSFGKLSKNGGTPKRISPVRLGNLIARVRSVFKYGNENDFVERPVKFGSGFKGPSKKVLRASRNKRGKKMFEAAELRYVIDKAKPVMKAMTLLAVNCGFGNSDIASLPKSAVSLKTGWIEFPRPKTGIPRRCPLWAETVEALKAAITVRPQPKLQEDEPLVFVTKQGARFVRVSAEGVVRDSVYSEFAKLLRLLNLNRDNLSFYALRHNFQTIGNRSLDPKAVSSIMGHAPDSGDMAATYTEFIDDDRLKKVTDHIHAWLWPKVTEKDVKKKARSRKS